jgi:hypothetical protein
MLAERHSWRERCMEMAWMALGDWCFRNLIQRMGLEGSSSLDTGSVQVTYCFRSCTKVRQIIHPAHWEIQRESNKGLLIILRG